MATIFAGKTIKSRYDSRVPVHIGLGQHDKDGHIISVRALCDLTKELAPIKDGAKVTVTCHACQESAVEMHEAAAA